MAASGSCCNTRRSDQQGRLAHGWMAALQTSEIHLETDAGPVAVAAAAAADADDGDNSCWISAARQSGCWTLRGTDASPCC